MNTTTAVQVDPPVPSSDIPTIIEFLLDETGSMSDCRSATIGGFNEYIVSQRSPEGKCLLTLTKFDTDGLKTPYIDLDIHMVPFLDNNSYVPGSMTNLFDAIGHRIVALEQRLVTHNWTTQPHILFIIMTDGMDNSSRHCTAASIREIIGKKEKDGWSFVYLGSNQDAWAVGQTFGMSKGNTMTYNTAETQATMHRLSEAQTSYRAVRTSGGVASTTSSHDFFENVEKPKKHRKIKEKYIKGLTADSRAFTKGVK